MCVLKRRIKRLLPGLMLSICAVACMSCLTNVPLSSKLAAIVEFVEETPNISDEEWELLKEDYYMIAGEFKANVNSYDDAEKQEMYHLIGKMNGFIAKREAHNAIGGILELGNSVPSIIDGFLEGLNKSGK